MIALGPVRRRGQAFSGIHRYVIVSAHGQPLMEKRSNGQWVWMTYKDRTWAEKALTRARLAAPDAMIHDKTPDAD